MYTKQMNDNSPADLSAGKHRKRCPKGWRKSHSKKAGKKGHCYRSRRSPSGKRRIEYSSQKRSKMVLKGGEAPLAQVPAAEVPAAEVPAAPVAPVLEGGAWFQPATDAPAPAASEPAATTALEAGKKCPRKHHLSYRTRSGRMRKTPKCVRSRKSHRRSHVPKSYRYYMGLASSPARGRFSVRCRKGSHRVGRSCRKN